jgi:hypothetical protein
MTGGVERSAVEGKKRWTPEHTTMDNPKLFAAFLNGVLRRTFFQDESMTPEFLKEEVFSEDPVTVEGTRVVCCGSEWCCENGLYAPESESIRFLHIFICSPKLSLLKT